MKLPYENATSGDKAVTEMQKVLRSFGCNKFGHMLDFDAGSLLIHFEHCGRAVQLTASFHGYAAAWLKHHPYTHRMRCTKVEHEKRATNQASISVYSVVRDWIKGQVTAIEIGMLDFEGAFLGQIMLPNGLTVRETIGRHADFAPALEYKEPS